VLVGRDTTKFTGDPIVANVTSQNYWTIYIDGASVNRANINSLTGGTAIVDTGNPGIGCNLSCAEAINTRIPLARLIPSSDNISATYAYPCNTSVEHIPAIDIAGQGLQIDPLDFNAGPVDNSQMDGRLPDGIVFCKSQITGASDQKWAIGLPFMHSWYTSARQIIPFVHQSTCASQRIIDETVLLSAAEISLGPCSELVHTI